MREIIISELPQCTGSVIYTALSGEVDPSLLPLPECAKKNVVTLPTDDGENPLLWAKKCVQEACGRRMCVLVPGTAFDTQGTRHGRGGGWYDRFLSTIPNNWLRIGVATPALFHKNSVLTRKPWDEPVDYIAVYDAVATSWNVYEATEKRLCIRT